MIPRGIGAPAIQIIHGYARQQAMRPAPDLLTGSVIDFQPAGAAAHLNPGAAQGHGSTRVNALMTIADQGTVDRMRQQSAASLAYSPMQYVSRAKVS
jgi:hypothetical protein